MPDRIRSNPFNRPPRIHDTLKVADIEIPAPPLKQENEIRNLLLMILPMASFLVMGLFYSLAFVGQSGGRGWLYAMPLIAMGIFTIITAYIMYGEQKYEQRQQWIKQQRDYHRLLDKKESRLLSGRLLQLELIHRKFPSPAELLIRVQNLEITLWERRVEDSDYLMYRLGLGNTPSQIKIRPPDPDVESPDIRRAFGIYREYSWLPGAPITVDFREVASMSLVGHRNLVLNLMRSFVTQTAILNSPSDVKIFLFSSQQNYRSWEWLRWLPHTRNSQAEGGVLYMAFDREKRRELLTFVSKIIEARRSTDPNGDQQPTIDGPTILAIVDDEMDVRDEPVFSFMIREGAKMNIATFIMCGILEEAPSDCQALIQIKDDQIEFAQTGEGKARLQGVIDKVNLIQMDNLSHSLLPISVKSIGIDSRVPTSINLLQVYQASSVEKLQIPLKWKRMPREGGLLPFVVPIGSETYASPLLIDLAENRDGPHGMIAGTTGSGKSQLLRTLVTALAMEHHPYYLTFMLIDFKGGSTFGIFNNLPHVVGMVSNLDKISALRTIEAIQAEVLRREALFHQLGVKDISDYHLALTKKGVLDTSWVPMPHLFIIVDEFAQMARDMPSFLPRLTEISVVGRSLGIHLILATQRPGGVVNDQTRANLNFRIVLRLQTIEDSRDMLRRSDAAYLPHDLPGRAYFQVGDGGTPRQFQTAQITSASEENQEGLQGTFLYQSNQERRMILLQPQKSESREPESIAMSMLEYMEQLYSDLIDQGYKSMDQILLPPLEDRIPIQEIVHEQSIAWNEEAGNWVELPQDQGLRIPIGKVDNLANRTQPPQWIDFLQSGGHVMVIGSPKSGKTSLLKSILYSLAIRYTPAQVNIYVLSFAGREMEAFIECGNLQDPGLGLEPQQHAGLPQLGDVVQGNDPERFQRLLNLLQLELENRKERFGEVQALDLFSYNSKASAEKRLPFICVMIDNFGELRNTNYIDEMDEILKLIQNGRMYGVHFILTALQSDDIPFKIANLITQRIALDLTDHTEYLLLVGRPDSLEFDVLPPGRCFVSGNPPLQCQLGLPPDLEDIKNLSAKMNTAWGNRPRPKRIGILPNHVYLSSLLAYTDATHKPTVWTDIRSWVGLNGNTLMPTSIEWEKKAQHYMISGPTQSGRTGLLCTFILSLSRQYSPEQVQFVLMDGSGVSLKSLCALPHVIEWVTEEEGLARNIACLQRELAERRKQKNEQLSGNPKEPAQSGPHIFFMIDDYDLTVEAFSLDDEVLNKLGRNIRQDSDLGFHIILTTNNQFLDSGSDPLIKQLKLARSGISLGNAEMLEIMGGRLTPAMRRDELPEGRGYLISRIGHQLIQFADPNLKSINLDEWSEQWKGCSKAKWEHPASNEEVEQVRQDSIMKSKPEPSKKSSRSRKESSQLIDQEKALEFYQQQQNQIRGIKE
jgi:DNA segregation ATPase FtsK/SpoIIIE, S-DNA-T family